MAEHVFGPLGMTETRYPPSKACGTNNASGAALASRPGAAAASDCPPGLLEHRTHCSWIAPTALDEDNQADPALNLRRRLLRGTVHDSDGPPTGGCPAMPGKFSTADDVGRFAQALLDRRAGRASPSC